MSKIFIRLLSCLLITSCTFDYDIKDTGYLFTPKIVVNGLISESDQNILYFTQSVPKMSDRLKPIDNARLILHESNQLLLDSTFIKLDTLKLDFPFRTGREYRIEIHAQDHKVHSSAVVPFPHKLKVDTVSRMSENNFYQRDFWKVTVDLQTVSPGNSLWIKGDIYNGDGTIDRRYTLEYKGVVPFADKINQEIVMGLEGGLYYNGFIRIGKQYLSDIKKPFEFGMNNIYYGKHIKLQFLTVPESYDRYLINCYEFEKMYLQDLDPPSMFNSSVPIFSNIEGGLGLFSGVQSYSINLENPYYSDDSDDI